MPISINDRKYILIFIILLSIAPLGLNLFGIDFGLSAANPTSSQMIFNQQPGPVLHLILELSAILVVFLGAAICFWHGKIHHNFRFLQLGIVLLTAAFSDSLHILSATNILINANNTIDFIPFTWALSRFFFALYLIVFTIVCYWFNYHEKKKHMNNHHSGRRRLLLILNLLAVTVVVIISFWASATSQLPKTTYPEGFMTRPFDIMSLGLMMLAAVLLYLLNQSHAHPLYMILLISLVPQSTAQLHMIFGSSALFDNHFNIAHGLKIVGYSTILFAILDTILYQPRNVNNALSIPESTPLTIQQKNAINIGHATKPLTISLPIYAFLLTLIITLIISFAFYVDTKQLLLQNKEHKLVVESQVIEPILQSLYQQINSDIHFISQSPSVQGIIDSHNNQDPAMQTIWQPQLFTVFKQLISNKPLYSSIHFIKKDDNKANAIEVERNNRAIEAIPLSRRLQHHLQPYYTETLKIDNGDVYFTSIEANPSNLASATHNELIIRAATPIFDRQSGELFAIVVIDTNFNYFMQQIFKKQLPSLALLLADSNGQILYDEDSTTPKTKTKTDTLQNRYPELRVLFTPFTPTITPIKLPAATNHDTSAVLIPINLNQFGPNLSLSGLVRNKDRFAEQQLLDLKFNSILMSISLAVISLALAVLFSRRLVEPLSSMSDTILWYEQTATLGDLPMRNQTEIGVLARSFYKAIQRTELALNAEKTAHEATENAVKETLAIVNSTIDAIITTDSEGKIIYFNSAAILMFGYQADYVIGHPIDMLLAQQDSSQDTPQGQAFIPSYLNGTSSANPTANNEYQGKKANGAVFPILLTVNRINHSHRLIVMIKDISKEKRIAAEINESRHYIDSITEQVPVLLSYVDIYQCYRFVNHNYKRWFGTSTAAFIGAHMHFQLDEATYKSLQPHINSALKGNVNQFNSQLPHQDGSLRYVKITYTPDIDPHGKTLGLFVSIEDITELKEIEQQLKELSWRFELALMAPGIGVWDYNLITNELIWDKRMFELYGVIQDKDVLPYEYWEKGLHPDDKQQAVAVLNDAIATGNNFETEFRVLWPNGEIRYLEARAKLVTDDNGTKLRMVGTNYDITDRTALEAAHQLAVEKAQESSKLKSEFLASMSHEIRTPMNGVIGMLSLLSNTKLLPEQRHQVELASASTGSLLTIINDILDFSKVEAGKLTLEDIPFSLPMLFADFTEAMAHRAQEKGLEFVLDYTDNPYQDVIGDPGRIRQVLNNLVGNAIKFTNYGEVVIHVAVSQQADQSILLHCDIIDTGIGIEQSQIQYLKNPFTQIDASTTRKYGGTGLGLAISQQLCDLMAGNIRIESTVNKGSCFTFEVELQLQPAHQQQSTLATPVVNLANTNILIIDSHVTSRTVLARQLSLLGGQVTVLDNLGETIQFMTQPEPPSTIYQIVFIDTNASARNELDLRRKIKANPHFDHSKIVIMTPLNFIADHPHNSTQDTDGMIHKPILNYQLIALLDQLLNEKEKPLLSNPPDVTISKAASNSKAASDSKAASNSKAANDSELVQSQKPATYRILLVEDNFINQQVVLGQLGCLGLNCDIAGNGIEALEAIKAAAKDNMYSLILMDCQMPVMDGYQATQAIRAGEAGKANQELPIIAITANAMKGDREKCLQAGMNDYLTKPLNITQLEAKIIEWVPGWELEDRG